MSVISPESARHQIIQFERGRDRPGSLWRPLLAEALQTSEEYLFGLVGHRELPRPLLTEAVVTGDVVAQILDQRRVHANADHMFGPEFTRSFVDRDLTTIEQLIAITPPALRREARRSGARGRTRWLDRAGPLDVFAVGELPRLVSSAAAVQSTISSTGL